MSSFDNYLNNSFIFKEGLLQLNRYDVEFNPSKDLKSKVGTEFFDELKNNLISVNLPVISNQVVQTVLKQQVVGRQVPTLMLRVQESSNIKMRQGFYSWQQAIFDREGDDTYVHYYPEDYTIGFKIFTLANDGSRNKAYDEFTQVFPQSAGGISLSAEDDGNIGIMDFVFQFKYHKVVKP